MDIKKCRYLTALWFDVNKNSKSFSVRCRPLKSGLFAVTTAAYSRLESASKKDGIIAPVYMASEHRPFSVLSLAEGFSREFECSLHGSLVVKPAGLMITFKPVGGVK